MNEKIKVLLASSVWQKLYLADIQPIRYVVTASLVILLVLAWVLTNPFFQLSGKFARYKGKYKNQIKN